MKEKFWCVLFVVFMFLIVSCSDYKVEELEEKVYIISYIVNIGLFFMFYKMLSSRKMSKKMGGVVKEKEVAYCRQIPKEIDLEVAYVSLYHYSEISTKKLKNGIIGAFILKWYKNGNISITNKGKNVYSIDLKDRNFSKSEIEEELYDLLMVASGSNNIIDSNEFKVWSRKHKKILKEWHEKLLSNYKKTEIKDKSYGMTEIVSKNKEEWEKKYKIKMEELIISAYKEKLRPKAEALLGLKKFLLDYSLIDEKEHIEIEIWEEYLIYAQLLGIADEVSKEFGEIYPDYSIIGQISVMSKDDLTTWLFFGGVFLLFLEVPARLVSMIISTLYGVFTAIIL